jgi:hypothetical protein
LGDTEGFSTLLRILKDDEAGYARQQASELLEKVSGRKFGYNSERPVAENTPAIRKAEEWYAREGSRLKWNPRSGRFE